MAVRAILFLSLWALGNAQEVQSGAESVSDDEDMKNMIEMLSDDNVLDQVAGKLADKLTDRASEVIDLNAMMDDTTLAKAAKDGAPPKAKAKVTKKFAPAPARKPPAGPTIYRQPGPEDENLGFFESIGQAFKNLDVTQVSPTMTRDRSVKGVPRGMREFNQKALPESLHFNPAIRSAGAFAGPKPMAQGAFGARPPATMRAPFVALDEEPEESPTNVFAVLLISFFAGIAITLGAYKLRREPSKASTLQGYATLHG